MFFTQNRPTKLLVNPKTNTTAISSKPKINHKTPQNPKTAFSHSKLVQPPPLTSAASRKHPEKSAFNPSGRRDPSSAFHCEPHELK
jgi:hypothetical protein